MVTLDTGDNKELTFEPGDHVAIFPANKNSLVEEWIDMMRDKPDPNWPIRLEVAQANSGKPNTSSTNHKNDTQAVVAGKQPIILAVLVVTANWSFLEG